MPARITYGKAERTIASPRG